MAVSVDARRRLGRSQVALSALGFGAGPIGNLFAAVSDDQAAAAVEAAWTVGIRYFDTAPHYGAGLAEQRLGAVLGTKPRAEFTLSTKVGRLLVPGRGPGGERVIGEPAFRRVWDFTADGVRKSLDASLDRLCVDRIDVVLIHDPDDHWTEAVETAYPALHDLRQQGVIGAIGVGMNQSKMLTRFVRECDLDCVLLAGRYTLLDRRAELDLLPACVERGVSVIAAGVLNSGVLAAPDDPAATYDYAPATAKVLARARQIAAICAKHGVPPLAAAVQFASRHPAVASVLVGCRSAHEVESNASQFSRPIATELWSALDECSSGEGTSDG